MLAHGGSLYAVSELGGSNNDGVIFSLTTNGALLWSYSFNGANGYGPVGVTQGRDGFLYGTAYGNGSNNFGGAFSFTTNGDFLWSVPFALTNGSGASPQLVQATDGAFYGTTRNAAFLTKASFFASPPTAA